MEIQIGSKKEEQVVDIPELYLQLTEDNPTRTIFMHDVGERRIFIFRALGRKEFRDIVTSKEITDCEKEEVICETCVLYPRNFDFANCEEAGLPTILAKVILEKSLLTDVSSLRNMIYYFRGEMNSDYDRQVSCVIHEAFPEYKIDGEDGIENWDILRTADFMSKAEFILHSLRGIPLAHVEATQDAEQKAQQAVPKPSNKITETNNKDGTKTKVTTKTISNNGKRLNQDSINRLMQIDPSIDWANANTDADEMIRAANSGTLDFDNTPLSSRVMDGSDNTQEALQQAIPEALRGKFKAVARTKKI